MYHSLFIHLVIESLFKNSPANFAPNAGRVGVGEEMAPGSSKSLKPIWGQGAESHSCEPRKKGLPEGTWIVREASQPHGQEVARQPGVVSHFSASLLPAPCRLSSRLCASAAPNPVCDRLWVTMITVLILYVFTIPRSDHLTAVGSF